VAAVLIEVQVDEKGAIQAFERVEGGLKKLGSQGNLIQTQLTKQTQQANAAAMLLGRTFGVILPQQLTRFLGTSKLIGPLLANAFNVAILAGFAGALIALIPKVKEVAESLGGMTEEMKKQAAAQVELNQKQVEHVENLRQMRREIDAIGVSGLPLLRKQFSEATTDAVTAQRALDDVSRRLTDTRRKAQETFNQARIAQGLRPVMNLAGAGRSQAAIKAEGQIPSLETEFAAAQQAVERANAELERARELLRVGIGEQGTSAVKKLRAAWAELADQVRLVRAGTREVLGEPTLLRSNTPTLIGPVGTQSLLRNLPGQQGIIIHNPTVIFTGMEQSEASRIFRVETKPTLLRPGEQSRQIQREIDLFEERRRAAAEVAQETRRIEEQAALASLPPWQQAYAGIVLSAQARQREVEEWLDA
jgi:hypothetical protein